MFEATSTETLLGEVRAHDFEAAPALGADADRIDAVVALDRLIRAAQAEQVRQIADLHRDRVRLVRLGQGDPTLSVIGEVAMARNIGPSAASTQVQLAIGMGRLPQVFDLFATGVISEATARAVATETASLAVDDFSVADDELARKIPGMTTFEAKQAAARIVIGIDAEAAHERARRNRADQQIMVQTLVERVTGLAYADDIDVEVNLVLDAETLLAGGDTPVELDGYGPISPDVADEIIARAPNASIRRLLIDPVDGTLLVREPRRRRFTRSTSSYIRTRDRRCRQPGCNAKIRHDDHVHAYEQGGLTVKENGQGLCVRSHTIKHQPGWTVVTEGRTTVWRTPTGHEYSSSPPPVLGSPRPPGRRRQ
jgi:hypothetical protein